MSNTSRLNLLANATALVRLLIPMLANVPAATSPDLNTTSGLMSQFGLMLWNSRPLYPYAS